MNFLDTLIVVSARSLVRIPNLIPRSERVMARLL